VSELTQANNLTSKTALVPGRSLIIPMSGMNPPAAVSTQNTAKKTSPSGTATSSYTVRKGDNLSDIATRFHVTVNDLKKWNKLTSNQIVAGKKLIVAQAPVVAVSAQEPRKVVHQVLKGETLVKIASEYKTTVNNILSWNKRNDLSVLHPGDQITIFVTSTN
jgi:membrane-bound lytic murein transglycosylase D